MFGYHGPSSVSKASPVKADVDNKCRFNAKPKCPYIKCHIGYDAKPKCPCIKNHIGQSFVSLSSPNFGLNYTHNIYN